MVAAVYFCMLSRGVPATTSTVLRGSALCWAANARPTAVVTLLFLLSGSVVQGVSGPTLLSFS